MNTLSRAQIFYSILTGLVQFPSRGGSTNYRMRHSSPVGAGAAWKGGGDACVAQAHRGPFPFCTLEWYIQVFGTWSRCLSEPYFNCCAATFSILNSILSNGDIHPYSSYAL
jgi:hypothetical protein